MTLLPSLSPLITPRVLGVITNYRRPQNMPAVLAAWRAQSYPLESLIVVDNSPNDKDEVYPNAALELADDVWRFRNNAGCVCKWAPALTLIGYDLVLFADDDLIPGPAALALLLETARAVRGEFSTIGTVGRVFDLSKTAGDHRYSGRRHPLRGPTPVSAHLTCQVHLVRHDLLPYALLYRQRLLDSYGLGIEPLLRIHDDFLLCLGIQSGPGFPTVVPRVGSPEEGLPAGRLDEGNVAVWRRPEHFAERNRLVEMAIRIGWSPRPLVIEGKVLPC